MPAKPMYAPGDVNCMHSALDTLFRALSVSKRGKDALPERIADVSH